MNNDNEITESEQRWAINVDLLQANARSLTTLVKSALCPKCRKKLKTDEGEVKPKDLFKAIKTCCSKSTYFITPSLPLQESIFRIFLANGNLPLTLEEVGNQLNQWRGLDIYRTSIPVLSRLLRNDSHYCLQPVPVTS